MNTVFFKNLGIIDFKEAWGLQESILSSIIEKKRKKEKTKSQLLFCQHPHVYTLGKSGKKEHLLLKDSELNNEGIDFYKINRGGDITYHGPGQLVVYPVLDLDCFFTDIHRYLRCLEEVTLRVLSCYGLNGVRLDGSTGVWLKNNEVGYKKICAMGVRASRWVTMHGLAFNVNVDLNYFNNIVPCGITNKGVTSLNLEVGHGVDFCEVESFFLSAFEDVFECKIISEL